MLDMTAVRAKGTKTAKVTVKVADLHAPTKITIDQGKKATVLLSQATLQLSATVESKRAPASGTVVWTTSKAAVAAVDGNGLVTLNGKGTAKITAAIGKKKATFTLTVK